MDSGSREGLACVSRKPMMQGKVTLSCALSLSAACLRHVRVSPEPSRPSEHGEGELSRGPHQCLATIDGCQHDVLTEASLDRRDSSGSFLEGEAVFACPDDEGIRWRREVRWLGVKVCTPPLAEARETPHEDGRSECGYLGPSPALPLRCDPLAPRCHLGPCNKDYMLRCIRQILCDGVRSRSGGSRCLVQELESLLSSPIRSRRGMLLCIQVCDLSEFPARVAALLSGRLDGRRGRGVASD